MPRRYLSWMGRICYLWRSSTCLGNAHESAKKEKGKVEGIIAAVYQSAFVAITLMIAESRPEEKDIMVALVMNFLTL